MCLSWALHTRTRGFLLCSNLLRVREVEGARGQEPRLDGHLFEAREAGLRPVGADLQERRLRASAYSLRSLYSDRSSVVNSRCSLGWRGACCSLGSCSCTDPSWTTGTYNGRVASFGYKMHLTSAVLHHQVSMLHLHLPPAHLPGAQSPARSACRAASYTAAAQARRMRRRAGQAQC